MKNMIYDLTRADIKQSMTCLQMNYVIGKQDFCLSENKGADQFRSNCEADQRLCFRYTASSIPLLSKSKT